MTDVLAHAMQYAPPADPALIALAVQVSPTFQRVAGECACGGFSAPGATVCIPCAVDLAEHMRGKPSCRHCGDPCRYRGALCDNCATESAEYAQTVTQIRHNPVRL